MYIEEMTPPFRKAGYTIEQTKLGKQMRAGIHTLDRLGEALYNPHIRQVLFHAQVRKGHAYTYAELQQMAQPKAHHAAFRSQVERLVFDGILRRGYWVACPECETKVWYPSEYIREPFLCEGCRHQLMLPLEAMAAFRLNPLWASLLKNGATSVLLAFKYLVDHLPEVWGDVGWLVQKHGQTTEIDLLFVEDPQVYALVECKDALPDIPKVQAQLTQLKTVADELGAQCYLATLEATLPADLAAWLKERAIQVLLRGDLLGKPSAED
jgi:hypothetical protein